MQRGLTKSIQKREKVGGYPVTKDGLQIKSIVHRDKCLFPSEVTRNLYVGVFKDLETTVNKKTRKSRCSARTAHIQPSISKEDACVNAFLNHIKIFFKI